MTAAREIMNKHVESVSENETVDVAAKRMRDGDVGALLVTGKDGALRGMVTDRDIVTGCIASGHDPAKCTVATLAQDRPVVVEVSAGLDEVLATMGDNRIRRVPVTDKGALVGVIGISDLVDTAGHDRIGAVMAQIVAV